MVARPGDGIVVLIAEDFEDAREMYADYLAYGGMTVITAVDGAQAVRLATEHRPDVIVMDAGLPRLTGWEATAMLKGNPDTCEMPILMLTGHVFRESERTAKEAGVDAFVSKPCLPDDLCRAIVTLAREARTGSAHSSRETTGPTSPQPRPPARRARQRVVR
jgi:two-component system cell cycle response regulator DivK